MNEVLIRFNSRFAGIRHFIGNVIIDSSAKFEQSVPEKFEESVPKDELYVVKPSHFIVRPDQYLESHGKVFKLYRGDSKVLPHIMTEEELNDETIDKDRIIDVPIQLKFMFESGDIVRALNDYCGIAYSNKDLLFSGDLSHLLKCSSIRNYCDEVIKVDFYNLQDSIYSKVSNMIDMIPRMTHLFIHFDIGLKKDITGCAICYYDGEREDPSGNGGSYPLFKFPAIFGISRYRNQSTSLDHIYQFIVKLMDRYTLTVSFDSFASVGLLQSLQRLGSQIETKTISVDRTTEPYFMFKNVVNTERCKLPYCERLLRECSELRIVTYGTHVKVDHPQVSQCTDFDYKNATGEMPGSKDLADSACSALFSCYQNYSERMESGFSSAYIKESNAIKQITPRDAKSEAMKHFQGMLEDIFQ